MTNTLLISEKYVKTQSNIQDNVWGDFLTPAIREAQDIELQPIIGRPLYKKILKEVEEKDVEERFKTLIEDWIQPYLLYQTIVSLIPIIGTKLGNIGTVISNDEHVQNISSSERENLEYRYRYLADHYKSELQKYLLANKDLYPELTSTCIKNLNLKSSNSLPLWTGGLRHGQRETTDCPDKADYADPDGRKAGYIEGGKTVSVTKNNATTTLLPSEGYDGFSSVEVEVNVPIQDKKTVEDNVNIPAGGSQTVVKTIDVDDGYDGMKSVDVTLNVSASLDKIPLLKGQTLRYSNINLSKVLYNKEIIPNDLFIINEENKYKNYNIFLNSGVSYILRKGTESNYTQVEVNNKWGNDWRSMPTMYGISNNFGFSVIDENEKFYTPKIIFEGETMGNYMFNHQDGYLPTCKEIVFDLENVENIREMKYSFNRMKIPSADYFKFWKKIPKNLESVYDIFYNTYCDKNIDYVDLNNFKYEIEFSSDSYPFGYCNLPIDISDIVCVDPNLLLNGRFQYYGELKKIKISSKYFEKKFNTYDFSLIYWRDLNSINDFVNALPIMETPSNLKLWLGTSNLLTDEQKSIIAEKNWTIAS